MNSGRRLAFKTGEDVPLDGSSIRGDEVLDSPFPDMPDSEDAEDISTFLALENGAAVAFCPVLFSLE